MLRIYADAAYQPRTQEAGVGLIFISSESEQFKYYLSEVNDNHEAEFIALYIAMQLLKDRNLGHEMIQYYSDSQIVVDSLHKRYVKHPIYAKWFNQCLPFLETMNLFFPTWIADKNNRGADQLARQGLHQIGIVTPFSIVD